MSQYYKVTAYAGVPHQHEVEVTLPLVGPQGPAGPAGAAGASAWNDITGKPSTFAPSAHSSSHHTGGTDAIAPNNISAAWATVESIQTITGNTLLAAGRNRTIKLGAVGVTANVDLPYADNEAGDVVTLIASTWIASTVTIRRALGMSGGSPSAYSTLATLNAAGQSYTFVSDGTATGWTLRSVDTHTHAAADITSGTLDNARVNFAAPAAIGSTTPSTGAFTTLSASSALTVPSAAAGTPAAGHVYRVTDTLRYRDSSAVERTIALTSDIPTAGSTNLWIPASAWIPRTTTGCGVDSRETSTNRTNWDELLFDAGSDEFAQAVVVMPSNYNNSTLTARFYWTASSAGDGTDDVIWGIQGRAFANDDALDTAFGTAQTVTDTLLATNDMHVTSATSAVTIGGTPAANTPILFQIYRDADAGGDNYSHDAHLLGVEIIYN